MTLETLSTVLLYAGIFSVLASTLLTSRSVGGRFPSARKWQAAVIAFASLTFYASLLVLWSLPTTTDKSWLIFPLWLVPVLVVLLVAQAVVAFRSPQPASQDRLFTQPPTSLLNLAVATVAAVLTGYGLGWMIGQMGVQFFETNETLTTILCVAGAVIATATMVPVFVMRLRAAAQHRRIVERDQPMSFEVVDHAMKVAGRSALESYRGNVTTLWIVGGILILGMIMLVVPFALRTVQMLPGDDSEIKPITPGFLSGGVGVTLVVLVFVGMSIALVNAFGVPFYREARRELAFAGLTDEQREEAVRRRFREPITHRFTSKLRGAGRSIRVLTVRRDGTVITETLPGTELLDKHSSPLYLEEGDDLDGDDAIEDGEGDPFDEVEVDDDNRLMIEAMRKIYDRLDDPAHAHLGVKNFDVFDRGREQLHIVAVGDDDYLDFPDDITQDIRDAL